MVYSIIDFTEFYSFAVLKAFIAYFHEWASCYYYVENSRQFLTDPTFWDVNTEIIIVKKR